MSSTNLNKILIGGAGLCAVSFIAYRTWLLNANKMSHIGCDEHMKLLVNKEKMIEILEDLRIELTPHFIHFYNMLNALDKEYDEPKSAVLHTIRQRVRKDLEEK